MHAYTQVKRTALSSQPIPITSVETHSVPLGAAFFIQYFHNMKSNSDSVRICLQKVKKHRLVHKVCISMYVCMYAYV